MSDGVVGKSRERRLRKLAPRYTKRAEAWGRSCGDCTLCCKVLEVDALDKPANHPCKHMNGGCGIYADRPAECRFFYCAWRFGVGEEHHRPDRVGFFVVPPGESSGNWVFFLDTEGTPDPQTFVSLLPHIQERAKVSPRPLVLEFRMPGSGQAPVVLTPQELVA